MLTGVEPAALGSAARCSTVELQRQMKAVPFKEESRREESNLQYLGIFGGTRRVTVTPLRQIMVKRERQEA